MTREDWFVPGGAVITGDLGMIRLRPPETWRKDVLEVRRKAISMNDNRIRSHWTGFHKEKKAWQEEIEMELMSAKTPRDNQRAICGAFVRFDRRPPRPPDPNNFATLINKALGDALQNYGAIPDDDTIHYFFGGIEFELEIASPARTTIWVYTQPKEMKDVDVGPSRTVQGGSQADRGTRALGKTTSQRRSNAEGSS